MKLILKSDDLVHLITGKNPSNMRKVLLTVSQKSKKLNSASHGFNSKRKTKSQFKNKTFKNLKHFWSQFIQMELAQTVSLLTCLSEMWLIKVQMLLLMTLLGLLIARNVCKKPYFYQFLCRSTLLELGGLGKVCLCLDHQVLAKQC